ncbi:MAG TPA: hypothetical protein VFW07_24445 [Parafilimonas sp.]|nr:hypothetical protein [Parafilimonas sp.]
MRTKNTIWKSTVVLLFIITSQILMIQNVQNEQRALTIVKKNAAVRGQSNDYLNNACISEAYTDVLPGATLVYLQQKCNGIDLDKLVQVSAFKNETLISYSYRRLDLNAVSMRLL